MDSSSTSSTSLSRQWTAALLSRSLPSAAVRVIDFQEVKENNRAVCHLPKQQAGSVSRPKERTQDCKDESCGGVL